MCKIIPANRYKDAIRLVNFVYETNHKRIKQPICSPLYRLYIVTNGTASFTANEEIYSLKIGSIFFVFPNCPYELKGDAAFRYAYISITGDGIKQILYDLAINENSPVYNDFDDIVDFWLSAFFKITPTNAPLLTESVLFYTLSLINNRNITTIPAPDENMFYHVVVDFIDNNFAISELSLSYIATVFSYSPKYISYIFKKNMGIGFSTYVQNLRVKRAIELMKERRFSIKSIASLCGYNDPLYFSKVFKKKTGISPAKYIKSLDM